jgi:hypothetical protein
MAEHDIALAKQAGFEIYNGHVWVDDYDYAITDQLSKFAELIRAEKPQGEAVYQARIVGETKKGEWSDYCKEDYDKLLTVPHIAECRILYTTPPDQSEEIARLNKFISNAFLAHPNLDLDIEAVLKENT